jgi:hypothetical protein
MALKPGELGRKRPERRIEGRLRSRMYTRIPDGFYVYAIIDPRDGLVRYVGLTVNPKQREGQHRKSYQERKSRIGNFLKELAKAGIQFEFKILEKIEIGEGDPLDYERKWIERLRTVGHPLLNRHPVHDFVKVVYES